MTDEVVCTQKFEVLVFFGGSRSFLISSFPILKALL